MEMLKLDAEDERDRCIPKSSSCHSPNRERRVLGQSCMEVGPSHDASSVVIPVGFVPSQMQLKLEATTILDGSVDLLHITNRHAYIASRLDALYNMVQLTITPAINQAIEIYRDRYDEDDFPTSESSQMGEPISHGQIIELWKGLRDKGETKYPLEDLLRGSKVYVPPPPPKPEPVSLPSWMTTSPHVTALLQYLSYSPTSSKP